MSMKGQPARIVDLNEGNALIVTDLHGDSEAFERCRDLFHYGHVRGELDHIIFCGDLIHRESTPAEDGSLTMLAELVRWQQEGPGNLIYLLGNHELAHLYRIDLRKGNYRYLPRMSAAMGPDRPRYLDYLAGLPFFVRTAAGVTIAHTGVGALMLDEPSWQALLQLDHEAIWQEAAGKATPERRHALRRQLDLNLPGGYRRLVAETLHIEDPQDPAFDDLLVGQFLQNEPIFDLLWESFFNQNELDYGLAYDGMVARFLRLISVGFSEQAFLITGHMGCYQGARRVNEKQLRVASAAHAWPREEGKVLRLELGRPVGSLDELEQKLVNLF